MPIYAYKCPECSAEQDVIKSIRFLDLPEPCEVCGTDMQRQICAPMVQADLPGYDCPITGKWIEGRKAHEENLKRHGCRVYEPGETDEATRARAAADMAFEASIEATVEEFVEKLPTRKREQLAIELENGADVTVSREGA
jgi:putative FmdB family regulatory protein